MLAIRSNRHMQYEICQVSIGNSPPVKATGYRTKTRTNQPTRIKFLLYLAVGQSLKRVVCIEYTVETIKFYQ